MAEPRTKKGLKPAYTKRVHSMVASIIAGELDHAEGGDISWMQMRRLASEFCKVFAADNHTFDPKWFLYRCGFPLVRRGNEAEED